MASTEASSAPVKVPPQSAEPIMRLESLVRGNSVILGYRRADLTFKELTFFRTRRRNRTSIIVVDDTDRLWGIFDYHLLNHLWKCFLAAAGLLDVLAWFLPKYVRSSFDEKAGYDEDVDDEMAQYTLGNDSPDPFAADVGPLHRCYLDFVLWLEENANEIYFFFLFLWLANALFSAYNRRRQELIDEERRFLIGMEDDYVTAKTKKGALVAYYVSVALQFLFLPVGFYLGLGSLVDVIILRCSHSIMGALRTRIKLVSSSIMSKASRTLLERAVQNPYQFYYDLQEFLAVLRWVKYLAPLIAVGNKLLGETLGVLKRQQLWGHAKRMRKATQLLWGEKERRKLTRDSAATAIQTSFRAHWARRARRSLLLINNSKDQRRLLMIQRKFRRRLRDARERTAAKKRELKLLQMMRRRNSQMMSPEDKRKMYQLQDELGKKTREVLNRKLLLRPNTKFAVFWKAFVIVAVLGDITHKAVKPRLGDLSTGEFLARTLVPTRLSDQPDCQAANNGISSNAGEEDFPWYCRESIVMWQEGFRDVAALALIPTPVSEWPECQEKKRTAIDRLLRRHPGKKPLWYCLEPHPERHAAYRALVDSALERVRYLLGIVMFLDVFVTFFTGRFHPRTGELIPAPWFLRWLFPGLVFQLIVNPNVAEAARVANRCLRVMFAMGPYRTYQHVVAVGFPLAYSVANLFMDYLWQPLVLYANTVGGQVSSSFLKRHPSIYNY